MEVLNKKDLENLVGKTGWLDNDSETLIGKIDYVSGISGFDKHLNGTTQKEYDALIHVIKKPKGFQIKLAENFTSNSIGIPLQDDISPPMRPFEWLQKSHGAAHECRRFPVSIP